MRLDARLHAGILFQCFRLAAVESCLVAFPDHDLISAAAERQLLRMRVKARKGTVRKQRAASAKN